ncbi:CDP-glycerol glycerophosphotransferase family protein [Staphylococcus sp. 11261D007BR]
MRVNILGFNIFAKGGTSRSNINLIKSMLAEGHEVVYFNYQPFNEDDIVKFMVHENIINDKFTVCPFDNEKALSKGDYAIITRESFFKYAQNIKHFNKTITVVGEIHGPLTYLPTDFEKELKWIDAIRVSTPAIKKTFEEQYNVENVFSMYVNAEHIHMSDKPSNTRRNILIKSRFEDNIKDISYAIRLMNYIVQNYQDLDVQLYIEGYGPSSMMYQNLVRYYQLENNVHINQKHPQNYIYMSTSPYETLGYSILEAIGEGNQALIYRGDDHVMEEIYSTLNGVAFLTKDLVEDAQTLIHCLDHKYTREMRAEDIELLHTSFLMPHYATVFLAKVDECVMTHKGKSKVRRVRKRKNLDKVDGYYLFYEKLKEKFIFRQLLKNKAVKKLLKRMYHKVLTQKVEVDDKTVFIESFHGSNFSGDPKYIALAIKEYLPDMTIFVSSKNSLVDMEIRHFGLIPVRFGSPQYMEAFKMSKYIFVNGNTWDKVGKHPEQIIVQTWHGFPLKKMVGTLNDVKEREKQLNVFLPRMMKWDYILTSSKMNKMLLKSAFKMDKNQKLACLSSGAPRNSYLITHNTSTERLKIQLKYFNKCDETIRYILFCPTWRTNKRKSVSNIDLKKLMAYLPENIHVIVKLHPNESYLRTKYNHLDERIHSFYNELVDIQELYIISDWMITDYSSTIFDYAHLNRPIFLLTEDDETYNESIGFNFDIHQLGHFPVAPKNEATLAKQILMIQEIDYTNVIQRLMNFDRKDSDKVVMDHVITDAQ